MRVSRIDARPALAAILLAAASACVAPSRPAPPATPPPAPTISSPAPAPPPPSPPPAPDWRDIALSAGDWSYQADADGSEARFAEGALALRCDKARRQVRIVRPDAGPGTMLTIRTSFGSRGLAAGGALAPGDPLLDQIAFSRGRFTVEAAGAPILVLPAWPEPARVIEDCRG